ncbi:MAG: hypothetical protein ACRD50_00425 [Candidatus Acidiferrales bacterium]
MLSVLAITFLCALSVRADEIRLKDGTKIIGKIVGYENDSFKIETKYGYAIVRRDAVVSIVVTDSPGSTVPDKEPATDVNPPPEKREKQIDKSVKRTAPAKPDAHAVSAQAPEKTGAPEPAPPVTVKPAPPAITASPTPPQPPPTKSQPEPIRESVTGNAYTNETYGFRMYKPPSWEVIEGARKILPEAITAMGTSDETTYLLIGAEPLEGPIEKQIASTEKRLQEIMDNYRPLGEQHITLSGNSATERKFRGSVDEHDWSGTVAYFIHGNRLFTVFGMTRADSDLVQIQENVISRAIASMQFTTP